MKSAARPAPLPGRVSAHFRRIWAGQTGLQRALLVDMLLFGTMLNLLVSGSSMALLAAGVPRPLALALFLSPFPYNVLLCRSVLRASDRTGGLTAAAASIVAVLWTVVVTLI